MDLFNFIIIISFSYIKMEVIISFYCFPLKFAALKEAIDTTINYFFDDFVLFFDEYSFFLFLNILFVLCFFLFFFY
jgi:hypothetical protein